MGETETRSRRRRRLAWGLPAFGVAAIAAVLPHLDVAAGGLIPVAQALLPVGSVLLLVLALVSLLSRAWTAAVVLALGALAAGIPSLTPVGAASECAAPRPLTVVTFNAKFAGADPAQFARFLSSREAEVVMLVETDEALIDALLDGEGLGEDLPYRTREVSPGGVGGSVILAAYPLTDEEDIPGSVFDQVSAVAALPGGGEVRLAAVHPPPPVGQPLDWHDALIDLDGWIRGADDDRLVVAGDFNASYGHPVLRRLAADLRDAAGAAGPIPWPTWPEERPVPPFTAIDHVLARGAVAIGWESAAIRGSDHRAVVGEWSLCDPASP